MFCSRFWAITTISSNTSCAATGNDTTSPVIAANAHRHIVGRLFLISMMIPSLESDLQLILYEHTIELRR
jgi:hypothetical protein